MCVCGSLRGVFWVPSFPLRVSLGGTTGVWMLLMNDWIFCFCLSPLSCRCSIFSPSLLFRGAVSNRVLGPVVMVALVALFFPKHVTSSQNCYCNMPIPLQPLRRVTAALVPGEKRTLCRARLQTLSSLFSPYGHCFGGRLKFNF